MTYRNKYFTIRCTEEEFTAVKTKVNDSGLKQQTYLLRAVLGAEITNTDGIKALIPEVKRIGNNINQIARHSNTTAYVSLQDLQDCKEELEHIWLLLNAALPKLNSKP